VSPTPRPAGSQPLPCATTKLTFTRPRQSCAYSLPSPHSEASSKWLGGHLTFPLPTGKLHRSASDLDGGPFLQTHNAPHLCAHRAGCSEVSFCRLPHEPDDRLLLPSVIAVTVTAHSAERGLVGLRFKVDTAASSARQAAGDLLGLRRCCHHRWALLNAPAAAQGQANDDASNCGFESVRDPHYSAKRPSSQG